MAKGALVVHERECAHSGVIRDAGAIFESYKVDVRDPNMELANNLCSWLKRRDTSGASRACPMSNMQKLPQLVCLPVRCQPGQGQVARDCKGGPPYDDVRCKSPQLDVGLAAPIYLTVRFVFVLKEMNCETSMFVFVGGSIFCTKSATPMRIPLLRP